MATPPRPTLRLFFSAPQGSRRRQQFKILFKDSDQFYRAFDVQALPAASENARHADTMGVSHSSRSRIHACECRHITAGGVESLLGLSRSELATFAARRRPGTLSPAPRQIRANRREALEILEGIREPKKNYEYSGPLKKEFEQMAAEERQKDEFDKRLPRLVNGTPLYRDIRSHVPADERWRFPEYDPKLRPYIVFLDRTDRNTHKVKSKPMPLDVPKPQFQKLMAEVAKRGWRDVLWLRKPGEDLPDSIADDGRAVVVDWVEY